MGEKMTQSLRKSISFRPRVLFILIVPHVSLLTYIDPRLMAEDDCLTLALRPSKTALFPKFSTMGF